LNEKSSDHRTQKWTKNYRLLYEAVRWKTFQEGSGSIWDSDYNSGSLRGDLIAVCRHFVKNSLAFSSEFLKGLLNELIENPEVTHLSEKIAESNLQVIGKIIERATIRGEIKNEVSDMVKLLPFEILRYHLVFMNDKIDDRFIEQLVNDIMLPAMTKGNNVEA
jgi:hypothetical protein